MTRSVRPGPGAAFVGAGYSTITRSPGTDLMEVAREAALDAVAAAGIDRSEIDGYVGIGSNPNPSGAGGDGADHVSAHTMVERLGLGPLRWAADVSGFAVTMAATAAAAIAAGTCTAVLGVRAVHRGIPAQAGPVDDPVAAGADQWTRPFGAGPGGTRFALRWQRYMHRTGARREDLWEVVRSAREHARGNPVAYFRDTPADLAAYLASPMICEPLSRDDCDLPVTGAGAFVMVSGDRARADGMPAAHLRGFTGWTDADAILDRAGLARADIGLCQLYDGYAPMLYEWLERLGWCDPGTAWKFVADGRTRPGGELPVNTFGGALGEGRLHGMGHLREAIVQIQGRAGPRQVPGAEHCLVQVGPYDRSALAVLSRDPA